VAAPPVAARPVGARREHLGVAVPSLAAGLALYRDLLGFEQEFEEEVPSEGVRVAGLDAGGTVIELLEPTRDDSPVGRFLSRRGPGLHHIAIEVKDLAGLLPRLKAAGVALLDEAPRPGSRGTKVAFIHPKGAHGVLLELVEHGG
jgi:methylmalonyl-CoA epimerase